MYEKVKKVDWLTVIDNRLIAQVISNDNTTYTLLADIEGIELNVNSEYYNNKVPIASTTAKFELACKMEKENFSHRKVPPKSLTKTEIEKILGYTIKIALTGKEWLKSIWKIYKKECKELSWILLSNSYTNLNTEMKFRCPNGHEIITTYGRWRNTHKCPDCKK